MVRRQPPSFGVFTLLGVNRCRGVDDRLVKPKITEAMT